MKDSIAPSERRVTIGVYLMLPGTEMPYLLPWDAARTLWAELDAIFRTEP